MPKESHKGPHKDTRPGDIRPGDKRPCDVRPATFAPDVLNERCPSRMVLNHVTSRWGVLVLIALQDGTQRFSALRRRIGGVSERMLTQTLKHLEQDGFVQRTAHAVVPPHVDYALTPMGQEVAVHVHALAACIEGNLDRITAGQGTARPGAA